MAETAQTYRSKLNANGGQIGYCAVNGTVTHVNMYYGTVQYSVVPSLHSDSAQQHEKHQSASAVI